MKYRSSTEIVDSILRSVNSGASKTRIMYKAYLSYSQLKEYLTFLQDKELIRYEEGSQMYSITEKGLRFMNAYDEIRELVSGSEGASFPVENNNKTNNLSSKKPEVLNW